MANQERITKKTLGCTVQILPELSRRGPPQADRTTPGHICDFWDGALVPRKYFVTAGGKQFTVSLEASASASEFGLVIESNTTRHERSARAVQGGASIDGRLVNVIAEPSGYAVTQRDRSISVQVADRPPVESSSTAAAERARHRVVRAPLPGQVVNVLVTPGTCVRAGQRLLVIEAMKMQNPIVAEHPGRVLTLTVAVGDTVTAGALLVELGD